MYFACLFVSSKLQNGPIFVWNLTRMIQISKICLHQNWIYIKFCKSTKLFLNPQFFYNVYSQLFIIEIEYGRGAPLKAQFYKQDSIKYLIFFQFKYKHLDLFSKTNVTRIVYICIVDTIGTLTKIRKVLAYSSLNPASLVCIINQTESIPQTLIF